MSNRILKKIKCSFAAVFILGVIISLIWMLHNGSTGKIAIPFESGSHNIQFELNKSIDAADKPDIIEITDTQTLPGGICMLVRALNPGAAQYDLAHFSDESGGVEYLFVRYDPIGILWIDGVPQGSEMLTGVCLIGQVLLLIWLCLKFHAEEKENPYAYALAVRGSAIIMVAFALIMNIVMFIRSLRFGLMLTFDSIVRQLATMPTTFHRILIPLLAIAFAAMAVSNIFLMIREGRHWQNFLGAMLILTLFIAASASESAVQNALFNLFKNSSVTAYVTIFTGQFFVTGLLCYLECMIITIVIYALKAARHTPAFDKDYVLILGCGIDPDGNLYPLLRGRVDRAVAFVREQLEKTGKTAVLMPSGGQGEDECISEGEAMRRYLLAQGIAENKILAETRSLNTMENMRFSKALIDRRDPDAKTAFSTTNYHVLRAGIYAANAGLKAEGMGSKTAWYFWPNAFARELVAMLMRQKKQHFTTLIVMLGASLLLGFTVYLMVI